MREAEYVARSLHPFKSGTLPVGFLRLACAVLAGGLRSLSDFVLPPAGPLPSAPRPTSPYAVRSAARPRTVSRTRREESAHPH
jgi:hypothetical protein